MSEKKQETVALLERMPEDKVDFVIEFIRQMEIQTNDKSGLTPKMQAFQSLEALRKQTVPDYGRELAEARDEKYGCFN